jgi:pyruvate dehydrogenase E2 component (dihydrolipoamide acetyltransferase)
MAKSVIMPKLGQTVEECTIIQWLKKEGDTVRKGDVLLEIETDKANMEVESFVEGSLLKILKGEGETVPVMEIIAFVGDPGEPVPEAPPTTKAAKAEPSGVSSKEERTPASAGGKKGTSPKSMVSSEVKQGPVVTEHLPPPVEAEAQVFRISPRAAKLARTSVIDPRKIEGSGPFGRIVESDVTEYLEEKGYDRIRITPAAKRLAADQALDLLGIREIDEGEKITVSDIRRVLSEQPRPLPRIRQVIAERLTKSFTTTPHFYVTVSVDVSDLIEMRLSLKGEGKKLSLTDFIVKATALVLREFPMFNSSTTDGKLVCRYSRIHVGLAVSVEEGLLVPVIRHADRLSLDALHKRAEDLATRARAGKLVPDEMTGSTFTISNMGMLDIENFAAIINPGESAILAISSVTKTPVVREDHVVVRSIMKMTLSADHRLVDGALAARFMNAVKDKLEDLGLWKRLM